MISVPLLGAYKSSTIFQSGRSVPPSWNLLIIDSVTCYSCYSQFLQLTALHC